MIAIVIAYDWPLNNGGGRIATRSTLNQLLKAFSSVHFVGLVDRPFANETNWLNKPVEWTHIPVVKQAPWRRFLKSLTSSLPAITMQFLSQNIERQILQLLANCYEQNEKVVLIFEDIHAACLLPQIRRTFPEMPIAIRSQNLTVKAFESFCYKGNWINRLAWCLEVSKIVRFEKQICQIANKVWAITEDDAHGYKDKLDIQCDGVFGVSLDVDRYMQLPLGNPFTLLYIGSTDLRKKTGLSQFINQGWRKIRTAIPSARFLLAGSGTQQFTREDEGIIGLGYCEDEREFLSRGGIFVNPQEDGSGIKLKSIVAMLAGKVLVTTEIGIEGIVGHSGEHFLTARDPDEMATLVVELMKDQPRMMAISCAARSLAANNYTDEHLWLSVKPLLEDFASL